MKHLKEPFKAFARYTGKQFKWVYCSLVILLVSLAVIPSANEVYSAGETGGTLYAVSPLNQQMKLAQPTASAPGGRGFMLPQTVVVKDTSGNPVAGASVTFEVSANSMITSIMRGYNSRSITVTTDSNGLASAANTYSNYVGEGYQVYSTYAGIIQTLQVKASIPGANTVAFNVEVGTYGSNLVDKTPPFISVRAKDDTGADYIAGTWTSHSVSVAYSATDTLSAIKSCTPEQTFNEEGANQTATGTAVDSANNSASITFGPINIDKSMPVTTATYPRPKAGGWYDDKVIVSFDSTDSVSGVNAIYYKIGDGTPVKLEGQSAAADIDIEGTSVITYWAVDNAGNQEQAKTFTVKIDRSVPVITSKLSPEKNEKGWNKYDVTLTLSAKDTYSGVKEIHYKIGEAGEEKIVAGDNTAIAVNTEGVTRIFFFAADIAGKTSPLENVEVKLDKSIPVVIPPEDISLEATAVKTPLSIGTAAVTDISDWTLENNAPEDGFPVGTTKVIWKATDSVGLVSQVVQNITVNDTTKPVITVQGDVVVEATAVETPVTLESATATDIFPVTISSDAPEKYKLGETLVTWKAKDANNNEVSATQKVKVIDSRAPLLKLPDNLTVEASGRRTRVDIGTATATDIFKVTITNNALPDYPIGTTYVAWKAADESNNVSEGVQDIKVQDTTKPQLTIPEDITMEAPSRTIKLNIGKATATDIFPVDITNNAPEEFTVGRTEVKWRAVDENKNEETKSQYITITDQTPPVITIPKDIRVEATGDKTNIPINPPEVFDIFETTLTHNGPQDNLFPVGQTVITWVARDVNGNSASVKQSIYVEDTIKPVLTLPEDIKAEATARRTPVALGTPSAIDIFPVTFTNDGLEDYPIGTTPVKWKATDTHGNSTEGIQYVTVEDTTKPVLHVPEDKRIEATAILTPVNIGQATATDIFTVQVSSNDLKSYPLGVSEVKWNARDENNNEASGTQKINIVDTTAPVISVPPAVTMEATGQKTPVELGEAEAADIFAVTITNNAPKDGFEVGTFDVIWTATDSNGNSSSGIQKVTVKDTTPPVLKVPNNITVEATAVKTPVDIGQASATDLFKVRIINNGIGAYPLGRTIVTWTAIDEHNNITEGTQEITVTDKTAPIVIPPQDMTFEATAKMTEAAHIGSPTVIDIFEIKSVSNNAPGIYPYGTTNVTWTAIDVNGNVGHGTQKINIADTTAPELEAPLDLIVEATSADGTPVDIGNPIYIDIFPVEVTNDAPGLFPVGTTEVTWTATDEHNNSTTRTQRIIVRDTTPPVLKAPADKVVEATAAEGTPVELGTPEYSDIFPVEVINDASGLFQVGTTTVTWTATDKHNNKTTRTQLVTVQDTTPPVLKAPADKVVEATAAEGTPVELGMPEYSDIFPVEVINDAPGLFQVGTTTVTWTATDKNSNKTTSTQAVTVQDTTPPELEEPEDKVVEATAAGTPVVLETPKYSDIFRVTVEDDAPELFQIGATTVTWTATDEHNNKTIRTQTVTVQDTTPPELEEPEDKVVEATAAEGTPVVLETPKYSDIFRVTVDDDAPELFPIGPTTVTWTATDEHNNKTTRTQTVTVRDTTPPELEEPEDKVVEATAAEGTPVVLETPKYSDIFRVTVEDDAPELFPVGTTTVTWTATDEHNNKTTRTQTVTVQDTTPPEMEEPEDKVVEATAAEGTPVVLETPKYSDIFRVTVEDDAPELFPVGTTTVTWTATDEHNNKTTRTQQVTVQDTTPPELEVPADQIVEATSAEGTPVILGTPKYSDIFKVDLNDDAPELFQVGTWTVTWTATDEHNNKTTGIQKVTVRDTTPPELEAPADKTVEATAAEGTSVDLGTPRYSDVFKVTVNNNAPKLFQIGTKEVIWTATDEHNNKTTRTQTVTVRDTTPPELEVPANLTVEATSAEGTPVQLGTPKYSDIFKVTVKNDAPELYPVGTRTVTWTATDENNNKTTRTQTVTVRDTIKPKLTVPADITVPATGTRTKVSIGMATATDIFRVTITNDAPADFPVGTTTVTWKATDENGNFTTGVQKITVVQKLKVKSFNATRSNTVNTIDPRFMLENTGETKVDLSDIKLRYYFTSEGDYTQIFACDYSQVSSSGGQRNITSYVSGRFSKVTGKTNYDCYLEISFSSNAGCLMPGEKVIIQGRFAKINWSNYTQSNDYSFNSTATDYTDTSKITVYSSGILIGGTEP
jgi:hypothetical protein